jgi:DNA-binding NtrC family response regulator
MPDRLRQHWLHRIEIKMNSGAHVLIVGRDQMLMQTRGLILGTYFQVETANRLSEAVAQLSRRDFDLVVLCQSLSDDEYGQLETIIECLQTRPRVLTLNLAAKRVARNGSDYVFSSEDGPYALLKKAAEILEVDLKARGTLASAAHAGVGRKSKFIPFS